LIQSANLKHMLIRVCVVLMVAGNLFVIAPGTAPASESETYTVTYDGNSQDAGDVPVDITSYAPGDLAIVHDNIYGLKKKGYIFTGWNTAADGSGTTYLPGQTFTVGTENITLYAKWTDPTTSVWDEILQLGGSNAVKKFFDVAYNGVFAAVGLSGEIVASGDGNVWTSQKSGTTKDLFGITDGDGKLVAVGAEGTILVSRNGADWFNRSIDTPNTLREVAYGNDLFLAVGDNGTIAVSGNGSYWTFASSGTSVQLNDAVYANGQFVVVGNQGTILTSSDGQEWTAQTSGTTADLFGVAASSDLIVAVGGAGKVLTSTDGVNWTARTIEVGNDIYDVIYAKDSLAAVGTYGIILNSPDGVSWTWTWTSSASTPWKGIAYGNDRWIVVGDNASAWMRTSADGINWESYPSFAIQSNLSYANGMFFMGSSNKIYTSENGTIWKSIPSNTANRIEDIAYGNGLYVGVGSGGTIVTSSNGKDWTVQESPTTKNLNSVAYGNGIFLAVGQSGTVVYSEDGVEWTESSTGEDRNVSSVTFWSGKFYAVGPGSLTTRGSYYYSEDGKTWSSGNIMYVYTSEVTAGDGRLVAVGAGTNDKNKGISTTTNGTNWSQLTSNANENLRDVTYEYGNYLNP